MAGLAIQVRSTASKPVSCGQLPFCRRPECMASFCHFRGKAERSLSPPSPIVPAHDENTTRPSEGDAESQSMLFLRSFSKPFHFGSNDSIRSEISMLLYIHPATQGLAFSVDFKSVASFLDGTPDHNPHICSDVDAHIGSALLPVYDAQGIRSNKTWSCQLVTVPGTGRTWVLVLELHSSLRLFTRVRNCLLIRFIQDTQPLFFRFSENTRDKSLKRQRSSLLKFAQSVGGLFGNRGKGTL